MRSEVPCREVTLAPAEPSTERPCLAVVQGGVEAFGERLSIPAWARVTGLSINAVRRRLRLFPPEIALLLPVAAHADPNAKPGAPRSWTWELLLYEDDCYAQRFVEAHPHGATLDEVGDALGIVRERVRQIEEQALEKLGAGRQAKRLARLLKDLGAARGEAHRG